VGPLPYDPTYIPKETVYELENSYGFVRLYGSNIDTIIIPVDSQISEMVNKVLEYQINEKLTLDDQIKILEKKLEKVNA